ncbi:MAG TPA: 5-(carboxyamino)imidazole ribonucleotide mutase [Polyangia bacterium]|nr:5-(carboxyamino)imidazole ribonucleotide mutase [Polyangia bacterium]
MSIKVGILMGSDSDLEVMKVAHKTLQELGITSELRVLSAHRTPEEAAEYARGAEARGTMVLIAGAGLAAHLAGALVAQTTLPVIGVPLSAGTLGGLDSLLSTVQMPPGLPVATVAIGGAMNAALLAAAIIALSDADIKAKLKQRRVTMHDKVLAADARVQEGQ